MLKNVTVGQTTTLLTLILGAIQAIALVMLFNNGGGVGFSPLLFAGILIGSVLITYGVVKYFIEYVVFKKIKLIYKLIDAEKKRKPLNDHFDHGRKPMNVVNDEVIEWAERRERDIETLTQLEDYRKMFLGNISHELKTPIFSLQGYILTLLEGGVYDEAINLKYLKKAAKNVERMQRIVEDLEQINELQSGQAEMEEEVFQIHELVLEVFDDLTFMAEGDKINLEIEKDVRTNYKVEADREHIRRVLVNLITNGIKYGKKKGIVKVGYYDLADKVLVEVEDDGRGVEDRHLRHLFDRFYRVDEHRNRKHGGSGLGLSIVKHIIEAHDQTISVKSNVGEGTTFTFTLNKVK